VAEVDPDDNEEAKVGNNDDRVNVIERLGGLGVGRGQCIRFTSRRRRNLPPGKNR
jgi:hypothetical protein